MQHKNDKMTTVTTAAPLLLAHKSQFKTIKRNENHKQKEKIKISTYSSGNIFLNLCS